MGQHLGHIFIFGSNYEFCEQNFGPSFIFRSSLPFLMQNSHRLVMSSLSLIRKQNKDFAMLMRLNTFFNFSQDDLFIESN